MCHPFLCPSAASSSCLLISKRTECSLPAGHWLISGSPSSNTHWLTKRLVGPGLAPRGREEEQAHPGPLGALSVVGEGGSPSDHFRAELECGWGIKGSRGTALYISLPLLASLEIPGKGTPFPGQSLGSTAFRGWLFSLLPVQPCPFTVTQASSTSRGQLQPGWC